MLQLNLIFQGKYEWNLGLWALLLLLLHRFKAKMSGILIMGTKPKWRAPSMLVHGVDRQRDKSLVNDGSNISNSPTYSIRY